MNYQKKVIQSKEDSKEQLRNRSRIYSELGQGQSPSYFIQQRYHRTEQTPDQKMASKIQAQWMSYQNTENRSLSQDRSYYQKSQQKRVLPQEVIRDYNKTINYLKNNARGPNLISSSQVLNLEMNEYTDEFPIDKELDNFNRFKKITQHQAMVEYNQEMKRAMIKKQEQIREENKKIELQRRVKQLEEESEKKREKNKWKLYDIQAEQE